eukprot:3349223-Alexandrium_andersonii.AAC.1
MPVPVVQGIVRELLVALGYDLPCPPWVTGMAQRAIEEEARLRARAAIHAHSRSVGFGVGGVGAVAPPRGEFGPDDGVLAASVLPAGARGEPAPPPLRSAGPPVAGASGEPLPGVLPL